MSVEQMNSTTEAFQITNDLMKKASERGDFKNLKQALKIMPGDFELSSNDSAAQLLRISTESLKQLKKRKEQDKVEESKQPIHHLNVIDEKKGGGGHKKTPSTSSFGNRKDNNSKENQFNIISNNANLDDEQDGYRALMNQISQASKIDFQSAAIFNNLNNINKKTTTTNNHPNASINSTTMLNESPVVKQPMMNGMKNWLMKKMAASNEVTKAKLEAARKRRAQLSQIQDMERGQMSKVNMRERVDDKIKKIRRQNMRKFL